MEAPSYSARIHTSALPLDLRSTSDFMFAAYQVHSQKAGSRCCLDAPSVQIRTSSCKRLAVQSVGGPSVFEPFSASLILIGHFAASSSVLQKVREREAWA